MIIETNTMHITPVGGNVFSDLGFPAEEAIALKSESDKVIAQKIASKDSLKNTMNLKQVNHSGKRGGSIT